ncbi:hypothetical protein ABH09_02305 [Treponema sp. OMZ 803]|jgi:hypothetical protein|uniref:Uncharacterized protein n=1 Tax=Treponema vincentii TaxID=69710 RepID=A0A6P1XY64_9SPIR|nr:MULTISPECIES: hypothetical protein [Treponema]QHX42476.1 hypothetical protein GWP43_02330 [Treponema vincentii]UTC53521.1 hypothetical protein ABH09_02305 [Treponema sp. OMZ 803]UTC55962.1 hypothetical protein E4N69_02390 [Treponema sp. OMZ 906]
MPEKLTTRLFNNLRDSFQSDWKLLSETEHFLASTPLQRNYEQQFALWRKQLQIEKNDAVRASIRGEIIALRKALRLEGYDLSLGSIQLIVEDFVNDDAAARGFQRVVICFCDAGVFWLSGEANHLELAGDLQTELERKRLYVHPEMHYLWFLWKRNALLLSGSATETKEAFERLQKRAQANPQKILRYLKAL